MCHQMLPDLSSKCLICVFTISASTALLWIQLSLEVVSYLVTVSGNSLKLAWLLPVTFQKVRMVSNLSFLLSSHPGDECEISVNDRQGASTSLDFPGSCGILFHSTQAVFPVIPWLSPWLDLSFIPSNYVLPKTQLKHHLCHEMFLWGPQSHAPFLPGCLPALCFHRCQDIQTYPEIWPSIYMSLSPIRREIMARAELSFTLDLWCLEQGLTLNTGPESALMFFSLLIDEDVIYSAFSS